MQGARQHRSTANEYRSAKGVRLNLRYRFTLIEFMIVVAIVAILMALAVPAYSDRMIRTRITECFNGAAIAKLAISEYWQSLGAWPPSLEAAGLVNTGASTFCTAIDDYDPETGAFAIEVNEAVVDSVLTNIAPVFTPAVTPSNSIGWNCTPGKTEATEVKYLPSTCRNR